MTLRIKFYASPDMIEVDFFVVESLVVTALFGTPWINKYVWSIDPPKRSSLIHLDETKEPFRCPLYTAPRRSSHPIRVSQEQVLPPFSETWVQCHTRAKRLSLLRPLRRRDRMVQVKNGVKTLLRERNSFACLVANFSEHSGTLIPTQLVGEAETVSL